MEKPELCHIPGYSILCRQSLFFASLVYPNHLARGPNHWPKQRHCLKAGKGGSAWGPKPKG